MYIFYFNSPLGLMRGATINDRLSFLGFMDFQPDKQIVAFENKFILKCKIWLDNFFNGKESPLPELNLQGTEFQKKIWSLMCNIPFGQTLAYKDLTASYLKKYKQNNLCNRATGHAVGLNPVALLIPCHRVIRSDGTIGKYHYGTERKKYLLKLEQKFKQK